ncbi:hypothetical protein [Streptomyces flavofungini]|uniref:Gram-positive cocci surface proteins LPxTG domain-containing protein n=1 Tax=Streptomyces flavofungini TaxID=68200 RepID=A0ABS0XFX5_9ACTN|nr:hypothetical protein [Streptomyces flavofungini]MBJ3812115.1 hypothetical protein [Streptomyces flavofungini]GHC44154.1 hypothetical protein GCM10010349_05910 [Streptomyces flavofungini]
MRLRSSRSAGVAVAAAVTLVPAGAGVAAAVGDPAGASGPGALRPSCATGAGDGFPISTRISGGPDTYERGGGFRAWSLELTNTTDDTCGNVHPVVVLVDRAKSLRPGQVQLEFDDGTRRRPVRFERTDRDENVGVLGGGDAAHAGPGFTLAPGSTRTVGLRLAFSSDAAPGRVVASAAVVRRRDDDGDWVGASNDYTFDLVGADGPTGPTAAELAKTGPGHLPGLGVTAAALLLGGVALVVGSRRLRARGS